MELPEGYKNKVLKRDKKKVDFEFQALGLELQKLFPKEKKGTIWSLFHHYRYTIPMIRDSIGVYKKRGIDSFKYFMGILNKK